MEKIKYITNRELLAEIHKSKNSYCFYEKPEYSNYDAIVTDLKLLTPEFITQIYDKKVAFANKKNLEAPVKENLVFRLMTDAHIPEETDLKKRKRNTDETSMRTCFHPFKHFIVTDGVPTEVGRSHWKDGKFCDNHGRMTNRLAIMLMLLVERYSRRANWRGYCCSEDTEALTQRGWLGIDDINTDDIILSYDMTEKHYKWSKIKSIFRDDYDGNMFHLTVKGMDALVTPGHKFVTDSGPKLVEYLLEKDKVLLSGAPLKDGETEKYPDDFVELVGWAVTEGHYNFRNKKPSITIYQNEGPYADRIRNCLNNLDVAFSEIPRSREHTNKININFNLLCNNTIIQDILDVSPDRVMTMDFILSLSQRQKQLLINTMIDADGWRTHQDGTKSPHVGYCQKDKAHLDSFLALCTLAGHRCTFNKRDIITEVNNLTSHIYNVNIFTERANFSRVENIDFHGAKRSGTIKGRGKIHHPNEPTVPYKGKVWCPETEYGTFIARRNGTIWLTHNTYNDEMRSHALLQLSEVGLRFNESKSDNPNPFAFYTTIIKNCLAGDTMILTREHGSVRIEEVAEQDVTLLDGNGNWVKCHIYDHGIQETVPTNFFGGFEKVTVRSTMEHGWITKDGEKTYTKDFVNNKRGRDKAPKIRDIRHSKEISDEEIYRRGVIHGIVYGDGSIRGENAHFVRLCSEKSELGIWLDGYSTITYPSSSHGDPTYYLKKSWCNLKELPETPGEHLDYLLGFLRGWFATDGCVSKVPTPTLCGDLSEYEWLKKWGPLVGWHVNGYTKLAEKTNFGIRKKISLNFHLKKDSMISDDFLREKHNLRWAKYRYRPREWRVYPGDSQDFSDKRMERVYCPVVETTESFALSVGILSLNCFTRILNNEKKVQHIRDDLLIMADKSPSYTRQVDNEIEQKAEEKSADAAPETAEKTVAPKKRGRKPKSEKVIVVN